MILIVSLLMVLPLAIYGYISITASMESTREEVYETNMALAEGLSGEISKIINNAEDIINIASHTDIIESMDSANMRDLLNEVVKTNSFINSI